MKGKILATLVRRNNKLFIPRFSGMNRNLLSEPTGLGTGSSEKSLTVFLPPGRNLFQRYEVLTAILFASFPSVQPEKSLCGVTVNKNLVRNKASHIIQVFNVGQQKV